MEGRRQRGTRVVGKSDEPCRAVYCAGSGASVDLNPAKLSATSGLVR